MDQHAGLQITRILGDLNRGDDSAAERLLPIVYDQLRALASAQLGGKRSQHTLQPTALVHEVYLRLLDRAVSWQDRAHFFAVCARAMRMILADHARRRRAAKRGGEWDAVVLDQVAPIAAANGVDTVVLDDVLTRLAALDERHARIVELRFFSGLNVDEVAHALACSKSTVENEWRVIRAWLNRELKAREA